MLMLIVLVVMAIVFGGGALVGLAMALFWGYCTVLAPFSLSGYDALGVSLVTGSWAIMGGVGAYQCGQLFVSVLGSIRHQLELMRDDRRLRQRHN